MTLTGRLAAFPFYFHRRQMPSVTGDERYPKLVFTLPPDAMHCSDPDSVRSLGEKCRNNFGTRSSPCSRWHLSPMKINEMQQALRCRVILNFYHEHNQNGLLPGRTGRLFEKIRTCMSWQRQFAGPYRSYNDRQKDATADRGHFEENPFGPGSGCPWTKIDGRGASAGHED